jgi:nucleoside-diphosphate-sugar epimerase
MKNILITGANGFIGSSIVKKLVKNSEFKVRVAVRKNRKVFSQDVEVYENFDISEKANWSEVLSNIDVVVHCAARVHVMVDKSSDPASEFMKVNTEGTINLAYQAELMGVKRFIYLSTIGVNGYRTFDRPFKADDNPNPHSYYAQSKLEAEIRLMALSRTSKMAVVIIRPPLVYGPNAPGNFGLLVRIIKKQVPLPFGAIKNKRSFVFLDNLVDLISRCLSHPKAANQIFLVSDNDDLSTTQFLRKLGVAFGKPLLLFPIPMFFLRILSKSIGKTKVAQQLFESLEVDIDKNRELLGWSPPYCVDEAFRKTAEMERIN